MKLFVSPLSIFALIGTLAFAPSMVNGQAPPPTGQRLRTLAGSFPIGFAAESDFWNLPDAAQYQQTASSEFSMLTPGNQLKWDTVEPQQNTFNFAPGDMNGLFAQQHNMVFHGHTLVWHNQLPGWLTGGSWTAASLTAVLQNHVDKVVGHFKGKIAFWDVVNEAFNDDGTRRASMWQNIIGQPYIEIAFQRARAADPNAVLVYNDFNIETINAKSDAVFAMMRDFQSRGIPIDGVGLQTHLTAGGLDYAGLAANMQRFANLGLKIYISEMDVRETVPASAAALQSQATVYQNVLDRCLLQPACKGFTIWGFTDKYSWIPGTFPGLGAALPFDQSYNAKPAYFALQTQRHSQSFQLPLDQRSGRYLLPYRPGSEQRRIDRNLGPGNSSRRRHWIRLQSYLCDHQPVEHRIPGCDHHRKYRINGTRQLEFGLDVPWQPADHKPLEWRTNADRGFCHREQLEL